jgi:hypothetical protein
MLSVPLILILLALGFLIANAIGKLPAWPSILCLILLHLVGIR